MEKEYKLWYVEIDHRNDTFFFVRSTYLVGYYVIAYNKEDALKKVNEALDRRRQRDELKEQESLDKPKRCGNSECGECQNNTIVDYGLSTYTITDVREIKEGIEEVEYETGYRGEINGN